jgi:cell division protein FtsI (penicillin-binding protein 3)
LPPFISAEIPITACNGATESPWPNAMVNGGYLIPPTFLKRSEEDAKAMAKKVIKPETSEKIRYLMRLNAEIGTAKSADVKGYYIGGKTGTSEKVVHGRYSRKQVLNSFTAIMPADNPQYQILITGILVIVAVSVDQIARKRG